MTTRKQRYKALNLQILKATYVQEGIKALDTLIDAAITEDDPEKRARYRQELREHFKKADTIHEDIERLEKE